MNANYPVNEESKKNSAKLLIQFIVLGALIYALFCASWWSFTQTKDFLVPAFDTLREAIVFSIIVQYGPQPALFFMGVFGERFNQARRNREVWIAKNRKEALVPLTMINDIFTNGICLLIASLFFVGLSAVDFMTNFGQVKSTRDARLASGTPWSSLLYWVMVWFSFWVLWVEELAGNVFVYFFMTCEQLAVMFKWQKGSFSKAQGFFQRALGPLNLKASVSGQKPTSNFPARNVPVSATERGHYPRPVVRPARQASFVPQEPVYHPIRQSYKIPEDGEEE